MGWNLVVSIVRCWIIWGDLCQQYIVFVMHRAYTVLRCLKKISKQTHHQRGEHLSITLVIVKKIGRKNHE